MNKLPNDFYPITPAAAQKLRVASPDSAAVQNAIAKIRKSLLRIKT
jgi:hypothetical protein